MTALEYAGMAFAGWLLAVAVVLRFLHVTSHDSTDGAE